MLAWHFVGEKLRDGRPIPADGEKLIHKGDLILCRSGLHASANVLDALYYAPGETVCRVECGGEIIQERDKLVCRERTILWRKDVSDILREFSRWVALDVSHLWDAPPVVIEYLKTGDETKRDAARTAARDAAWAAAWAAAWDAAWDAASAAARDAASAAARDAASAAARDAASAAAWDAAWAAAWAAARDAARDAARTAAWDKYNKKLEEMIINV